MDIYRLLNLKSTTTPEQVKYFYYKRLVVLHPNSRMEESNADKFIELTHAYKQYLVGNDSLNCYRVCLNTERTVACRCGGCYFVELDRLGRIECDYCSCFIIIEETPGVIMPPS
ncbi:hypothetical protein PAEPH01_0470 [Pancytospora epiphaga]|nr:hypothetical protein PAEPH01_0470 [Pancytospora epiphaga]